MAINYLHQSNLARSDGTLGIFAVMVGSSDETKPTTLCGGSKYHETDTGKNFTYDEKTSEWVEDE